MPATSTETHGWSVHKFGGTSLADADRVKRVVEILAGRGERPQAVIVSAMGGVTDALLELVAHAEGGRSFSEPFQALRERLLSTARQVLMRPDAVVARFEGHLQDIESLLHAVRLLRKASAEAAT